MPPSKKRTDPAAGAGNPPTPPTTIEPAPPPSMELLVLENNLVFRWNIAEVKSALQEALKKYSDLVVTEDNLSDMERTQKEIAGLRIKVDTFRKETKKRLAEPATIFDKEVQDLLVTIEEVEKPIKEQIAKYEDERATKRTEELTTFAKNYASGRYLRPENFKYEVPARLTNRSVSDTAAKREIMAAIDELLVQQGADDEAAAEERKREEETRILREQRDLMITILCDSQSKFLGLKTPITKDDILPLITPETPVLELPNVIEAECRKRQQVEQAAATAPAPAAVQTQDWHCPENCEKVPAYGYQCPDDLGGKDDPCPLGIIGSPPPRPAAWGPPPPVPPPTPVGTSPLFVVVLKFPRISIVNAGALKMWLDQAKIPFEVVSQDPIEKENE